MCPVEKGALVAISRKLKKQMVVEVVEIAPLQLALPL